MTGYAELRRSLSRLAPELVPELREGMKYAAEVAAKDAANRLTAAVASNNPRKRPARSTGRAAASIRALSSGNVIYLAAGTAGRVPYYGWLDFGGDLKPKGRRKNRQTRPFLKRGRFLYPAADATAGIALTRAEIAMSAAISKAGLD